MAQDIKKQKPKSEVAEENMAKNNFFDLVMCGAALFALLALASKGLMPYIQAAEPMNYVVVGAVLAFLMYTVLAPAFRR